jgi:hypothetical protein
MPADVVVVGETAAPPPARPAYAYGLPVHAQQQLAAAELLQQQATAGAQYHFHRHTTGQHMQQQQKRQQAQGPPTSRSMAARVAWEQQQADVARAVQQRQVTTHHVMQPDGVQQQAPLQQQQPVDNQQQPLAKYSVPWLLQRIELEKYAPVFQLHEIDSLVTLCALTKEDMVRILGLPLGAAVKIGKAIEYITVTKPVA